MTRKKKADPALAAPQRVANPKSGRKRKISSVAQLERLWEDYKEFCDSNFIKDFRWVGEQVVIRQVPKPVLYTRAGFCQFIGIDKSSFFSTYEQDPQFSALVNKIRTECEADALYKVSTGIINPRVAGLLLARYGWTLKTETKMSGALPVVIGGNDEISD